MTDWLTLMWDLSRESGSWGLLLIAIPLALLARWALGGDIFKQSNDDDD